MSEWKDNDVFRWSYKSDIGNSVSTYWCKSRIAVVRNGSLCDTYWMHYGDDGNWSGLSDGHWWTPAEAAERLELEYQGNLSDYDRIEDYRAKLYAPADILDMRHGNDPRRPLFLRKGAKKDAATMLAEVQYRIEKAESEARMAQWAIERLTEDKAKIERGELDAVLL